MDDAGAGPDPHLKVFGSKLEAPNERGSNEQYMWKDKTPSTIDATKLGKRKTACDLDFGTLDCPICVQPLSPPVYQCCSGHTICAACCKKLTNGCPSCSMPVGSNRNIAVEKILESVQVSCKRAGQGCLEVLKYTMKRNHEELLCEHRPYHCPVPGCVHSCPKSMMSLHMEKVHQADTFDVLKQKSVKVLVHKPHVRLHFGEKLVGLVHHEFWPYVGHIFFCTSFEASNMLYCLRVKYQFKSSHHTGPKLCNSLETMVYCNQGVEGSVSSVKRRGDFLVIPQLPDANFQISQFELNVTISPYGP